MATKKLHILVALLVVVGIAILFRFVVFPTKSENAPLSESAPLSENAPLEKKPIKFIKLTKESLPPSEISDGTMNFEEIYVYADSAKSVLPASSLKATASSSYNSDYDVLKLYDSNIGPTSLWSSNYVHVTGEWAMLELINPKYIYGVEIVNRNDNWSFRSIGTRVEFIDIDGKINASYLITDNKPSYLFLTV